MEGFTTWEFDNTEFSMEAELGQDAIEQRKALAAEDEARECLYAPNRFCELAIGRQRVWDSFQEIFSEWPDNLSMS